MQKKLTYVAALLFVNACTVTLAAQDSETKHSQLKQVYPTLTSGVLSHAVLVDLPEGVLLRAEGLSITQKELEAEIQTAPESLRSQLAKNGFIILENKIAGDLLLREAKAWASANGKDVSEDRKALLRVYFDSLTADARVTDEELRSFYEENKAMMGGVDFDQVRDTIMQYVLSQKRNAVLDTHIQGLGKRNAIEVNKAWITGQYASAIDNPVDKARLSGIPTMADFGASGCGACDMMSPILDELKKEYAAKANILYIDVREEQLLAVRYGIQGIPVQVFFDKEGKEIFRHAGFLPKDQIIEKLAEIGAK